MDIIFNDWRILMICIQMWLAGGNPYGAFPNPLEPDKMIVVGWQAYPPAALFIALPFAIIPWPISSILILFLSMASLNQWTRHTAQRSALGWFVVWLPLAQGIWLGQTTLLALVALLWAEQAAVKQRDTRAGLLLALALLKPQVGFLPIAWLLAESLWQRRWRLPLSFFAFTLLLWGGALIVTGPQIYTQWFAALNSYNDYLINQPLIFPPLGPLLVPLAGLVWYRYGRRDFFMLALLINTLIYPLYVLYTVTAIAVVVIRWNPRWPWYPLLLSWPITIFFFKSPWNIPDVMAINNQLVVATALLAILLPQIPWPWRKSDRVIVP